MNPRLKDRLLLLAASAAFALPMLGAFVLFGVGRVWFGLTTACTAVVMTILLLRAWELRKPITKIPGPATRAPRSCD